MGHKRVKNKRAVRRLLDLSLIEGQIISTTLLYLRYVLLQGRKGSKSLKIEGGFDQ